jgi:hypothetical protein
MWVEQIKSLLTFIYYIINQLIDSVYYREPICSNIIDTTNKHLMKRLKLNRDYHWESVISDTTKYIDELIDNVGLKTLSNSSFLCNHNQFNLLSFLSISVFLE